MDGGLTGSGSYGYQVSAVDGAQNESAISGLGFGRTPACSVQAGPARNLRINKGGDHVALQWDGTADALYQAECSLGLLGPWAPVDAPTTNFSTAAFGLTPSSIYRVALFTNTPGYMANFATNNADKASPSMPANLTVAPFSDNAVTISWDPATDYGTTDNGGRTYTSGLDSYLIYRDGLFLKSEPAGVTSTSDAPTPFDVSLSYSVGASDV